MTESGPVRIRDIPVPDDARPGICQVYTINPFDKFSRNAFMSPKERSEFDGICDNGPNQITSCYRDNDYDYSVYDFHVMCRGCPHAIQSIMRRWFDASEKDVWSPYWASTYIEQKRFYPTNNSNDRSYCYFISDGEYVKIGKANNAIQRKADLQVGNPRPLNLLFAICVKDARSASDLESMFHLAYSAYRINGEWFDILKKLKVNAWQSKFLKEEEL